MDQLEQKSRKPKKKKCRIKKDISSTTVNLTPIAESNTYLSGLKNYPDDWEDEDILMRSPSPKYSYGRLSGLSIDRSLTAMEPLQSPRTRLNSLPHTPKESSSETSPNGLHKSLLPPICLTNFPTTHGGKINNDFNHFPNILPDSEPRKQDKIISELRKSGIVKQENINSSTGGVAFSIDVKEDQLGSRKPPHFLEKLPEIPLRKRHSKNGSWQTLIEEKQRIAGARHEEYINTIAEKARERSARRKRAADKLREQLKFSKKSIEERLRLRLSTFEENKNALMREKLEKIRKMREREKRTRKRLQRQLKAFQTETAIYEQMKNFVAKQDTPDTNSSDHNSEK